MVLDAGQVDHVGVRARAAGGGVDAGRACAGDFDQAAVDDLADDLAAFKVDAFGIFTLGDDLAAGGIEQVALDHRRAGEIHGAGDIAAAVVVQWCTFCVEQAFVDDAAADLRRVDHQRVGATADGGNAALVDHVAANAVGDPRLRAFPHVHVDAAGEVAGAVDGGVENQVFLDARAIELDGIFVAAAGIGAVDLEIAAVALVLAFKTGVGQLDSFSEGGQGSGGYGQGEQGLAEHHGVHGSFL
ncbi:hypothetical protein D3C81_884290 [compost metagenome]